MEEAAGDRRGIGGAAGHFVARRADEPFGSGGDRVARGRAEGGGVCVRRGEPRPVFFGERRERDGGAEPRVRGRIFARERELQQVSRGEGSAPACAGEAAGGARESGTHGDRVAAARAEGSDDEIEIADRQSARNDRRAGRVEYAIAERDGEDRFFSVEPADEAADHAGRW